MATRSMIAKKDKNGGYWCIYCHWDGYPEHHFPILEECYNTEAKIDTLLTLGDLSVLEREIGEKHDFNENYDKHPHWCLAYHRDRGESWDDVRPRWAYDFRELKRWAYDMGCEYIYIWVGHWVIYQRNYKTAAWHKTLALQRQRKGNSND